MTQEARNWTDPYLEIYRPVPPAGPGVCVVCHSGPNRDFRTCASCSQSMRQVSAPTHLLLPISLCRMPGQLYTYLRDYKGPRLDVHAGTVLAATLGRFARQHWACVEQRLGGPIDAVTTVPSTRSRAGPHPLLSLVQRSGLLKPLHQRLLQPGSGHATHNQADDATFRAVEPLPATRVVLIDDTFTSGARAQSAASALHLAGAGQVAIIAIGRLIDPTHNDNCHTIWRTADRHPFTFDTCCWCPATP